MIILFLPNVNYFSPRQYFVEFVVAMILFNYFFQLHLLATVFTVATMSILNILGKKYKMCI